MRIRYVSMKSIGQFVAPVGVSLTLSATKHTYTLCFVQIDRSVCRSCAGFVDLDFTKRWYLQCFIEPDIVVCRSCAGFVEADFTKRWYLQWFGWSAGSKKVFLAPRRL